MSSHPTPPATRATLLERVRDPRDAEAWGRFAAVYVPMVRSYCVRRGLQEADATDVTQDVMQAVAGGLGSGRFAYDPARGRFRDYLFIVARSKLNDFFERQRRRPERGSGRTEVQEVLNAQPAPEEQARWDEDCRRQLFEWAAAQARQQFEERTWRAFYMMAVEGRSAKEVCAATGLGSANAVYLARGRVLARLRELVAELGDGQDL